MTVLLLDSRWPTQLPMEAYGICGPATFADEVAVAVRWNFGDILGGDDPQGSGVYVAYDEADPEVVARIAAGERVIAAPSRNDPVLQARQAMTRARSIGEWEIRQTHRSLLPYLEEEAEEFAEAVREDSADEVILKELSDVFLQVLFHAEIASRRGAFDLGDVALAFVLKLRSRAPYLFDGTDDLVPVEEQERLWAAGKAREREAE